MLKRIFLQTFQRINIWFWNFILHSRDVYNFIGINLVAPLSFIFCNYRFFKKKHSQILVILSSYVRKIIVLTQHVNTRVYTVLRLDKSYLLPIWDILYDYCTENRISIYNEGSFCLPSLSMLILSLSAILTKNVPRLGMNSFCQVY